MITIYWSVVVTLLFHQVPDIELEWKIINRYKQTNEYYVISLLSSVYVSSAAMKYVIKVAKQVSIIYQSCIVSVTIDAM